MKLVNGPNPQVKEGNPREKQGAREPVLKNMKAKDSPKFQKGLLAEKQARK